MNNRIERQSERDLMLTITVHFGYDVHSIEIDEQRYEAFKQGETVAVDEHKAASHSI